MKEKYTDSVQNRFTAYLVAVVGNTREKILGAEIPAARQGICPGRAA